MPLRLSSPHVSRNNSTAGVMQKVVLAMLPGVAVLTWLFGWGTLIQILLCVSSGLLFEAAAVRLRKQSLSFFLSDYSAVVTALLLAVAIPPTAPYWIAIVGMLVSILFGKQAYGGLGNNPFNPAMVAYALLLVSFPVQMTNWVLPNETLASFPETLSLIFGGATASGLGIDGLTGATPLDLLRNRGAVTTSEVWSGTALNSIAAAYQYLAGAWLVGGLALLYLKVFTWHTPISMILSLLVISALFYGYDPDNFLDPISHLTLGATMLGAFFIATDPVSSATSTRGKLVFGAGIGLLVFVIRTWGNYPDAIAFAVLLMNLCAPLIDQYTQPRTYGHKGIRKGPRDEE